jgi:dihydrolipoamide dehydrogenase
LFCDNPRVDMGKLVDWKDEVVGKLTSGVKQLLKANGTEYRQGDVTFVSPHEVEVKDAKAGTTYRIQAKSIVIATGSRPIEVPGFKFDEQRILSSTGALAVREVPQRLVVIGGGYIGLELGMCYAKLGSKVAVVEMMPNLLPGTDPDLVQVVARKMKKLGIEAFLEAKAKSDDGKAVTIQTKDGKEVRLDADKVLVTVGRKPNIDGMGLEKIGVKIEKGFIKVDEHMRTNVEGVYAIGDVAGQPMLAHKATKEGEVAAEVIAGHAAAMDVRAIPAVIFTKSANSRWRHSAARSRLARPMASSRWCSTRRARKCWGWRWSARAHRISSARPRWRSRWARRPRTSASPFTRTRRCRKRSWKRPRPRSAKPSTS